MSVYRSCEHLIKSWDYEQGILYSCEMGITALLLAGFLSAAVGTSVAHVITWPIAECNCRGWYQ